MALNTLQEIEHAIESLPPMQLEQLSLWFDERYAQKVDAALKASIDSGRFDELIGRAIADDKAGRTDPL